MIDAVVHVSIQVVPVRDFAGVIRAVNRGSDAARYFMAAYVQWNNGAEERYCFSCEDPIEGENFGGLAATIPDADTPRGMGFAAAFCCHCANLGLQKLLERFTACLLEETDSVRVH